MKMKCLLPRCSLMKILMLLALLLTAIQIYQNVLVGHFEDRQRQQQQVKSILSKDQLDVLYRSMTVAIESNQVMDSSGSFQLVRNLFRSNFSSPTSASRVSSSVVTLVSQCSINHIHRILDLSNAWHGPLSITIFVTELSSALDVIMKLVACKEDILIRTALSLHLVFRLGLLETEDKLSVSYHQNEDFCENIDELLDRERRFVGKNYDRTDAEFPANLLRNVAVENADTTHVFVVDIDMLPSDGLYHDLVGFLRNVSVSDSYHGDQVVFVVPVFELRDSIGVHPRNKKNLIEMWERKDMRIFYEDMCKVCQSYTNYSKWKLLPSSDLLRVGYEVKWKDPWEPFYVQPKMSPRYDERFVQYGFNRFSQSCELFIAGFRFFVLNDAFVIHRGFKIQNDFHERKNSEHGQNKILFRKFKEELKVKYPNMSRRC